MPRKLTVEGINQELKKVKIERRGNRGGLSLRATLPPRDGEGKPKQQYIALGLYDCPEHLEIVKARALELQADMGLWKAIGNFDWAKWGHLTEAVISKPTWESATKKFERDYFARRGDTPTTRLTWNSDYAPLVRSLQGEVSAESLIAAVEATPANTRTRQKAVEKLGKIAAFVGLEIDLSPYKGEYKLEERKIPVDKFIHTCRDNFSDNEEWQWVYSVLAVYGLRPHEVFFSEISNDLKCRVLEGKTGPRIIYPLHPSWAEEWEVQQIKKPKVQGATYRAIGQRVHRHFKRRGIGFTPYDLRHAYAIRATNQYRIPTATLAAWMGHRATVNLDIYNRWISEAESDRVFQEMVRKEKD